MDKEKYICDDCGCDFMVKDRNNFECPNCKEKELERKLAVGECQILIEELFEHNLNDCRNYLRGLVVTQQKE